eukprot:TRINITY_DN46652_c0_g1_i1.p1 TRINITY_DN46652_c0_g1~~TRINITY_DN46652_c0_g1_i1.p1  ORF type:complete len:295 (+),score=43.97 TRINITY_DN46652_c0_g1_i1:94-885(+)
MYNNKFIRLTSIGSAAVLSSSIVYFPFYFSHYSLSTIILTKQQESVCVFVVVCFVLVAVATHVGLLYLRSKGMLQSAEKALLAFLSVLVVVYLTSGLVGMVCDGILLVDGPYRDQLSLIYTICSAIYTLSSVALDIASTIIFVGVVKQTVESPENQRFVKAKISSKLIAKFGVSLSICSVVAAVLAVVQHQFAGTVLGESMYLVGVLGMMTVLSLWMTMKIKLDEIMTVARENGQERSKTNPPNHTLSPVSSNVSLLIHKPSI